LKIELRDYDWICHCYVYGSDDVAEIERELVRLECGSDFFDSAMDMVESDKTDIGFCYTSMLFRESVIYIGNTENIDQLLNTMFHEFGHLAVHIADSNGIDKDGEAFCYLLGKIGEKAAKQILLHVTQRICR